MATVFDPIQVGRMQLRNRIIAPPHTALLGNLVGAEKESERYIGYWRSLAEGGTALLIALNGVIDNLLPPGFDPSGVGARAGFPELHPDLALLARPPAGGSSRNVYSGREARHDGFDSVVLACGAVPDPALFTAVEAQLPQVHVLGDAFAPRRIAFAVQQGYQLAKIL